MTHPLLTLAARAMAEEYCGKSWDSLNKVTQVGSIDATQSALLALADEADKQSEEDRGIVGLAYSHLTYVASWLREVAGQR